MTLVCDDGNRYLDTYWDDEWLAARGFDLDAGAARWNPCSRDRRAPDGLRLPDGRVLGVHDAGPADADVVLWHGGSPNTGEPPGPWRTDGERWIGVDRPGYGRSTRLPGRTVADVADDERAVLVLDHLGIAPAAARSGTPAAPRTRWPARPCCRTA